MKHTQTVKIFMLLLCFSAMFFVISGCGDNAKVKYTPLEELPSTYSMEAAIKDKVYVHTLDDEYNKDRLTAFLEAVSKSKPANLRKMSYTIEGDPIIIDYIYDGEMFTEIIDATRDNFSAKKIYTNTYKYLIPGNNDNFSLSGLENTSTK